MRKELQQEIMNVLDNHEKRIQENTNDIETLKKEIAELKALTLKNKS